MKTFFFAFIPSISVKIWFRTRSLAPPASPPVLLPPRAWKWNPTHQKNITQGAAARAILKTSYLGKKQHKSSSKKLPVIEPYLFKVYIVRKLHVPSMDSENLQASGWVRDTNIDFSIETTKTWSLVMISTWWFCHTPTHLQE